MKKLLLVLLAFFLVGTLAFISCGDGNWRGLPEETEEEDPDPCTDCPCDEDPCDCETCLPTILVDISGESVPEIQAAIQAGLGADNDVIVTGTKNDVPINNVYPNERTLTLDIPLGRTVTWQADYSSNASTNTNNDILHLKGSGHFILDDNGKITELLSSGDAYGTVILAEENVTITIKGNITAGGDNGTFIDLRGEAALYVDDGTIETTGGRPIQMNDKSTMVIRSGTVKNNSTTVFTIRLNNYSRLAILGGTVQNAGTLADVVDATSTDNIVYIAGGVVEDGGIRDAFGTNTPAGYHGPGLASKFGSGFTAGTNLSAGPPPSTPGGWDDVNKVWLPLP